ncbi:hypothetical protein N7510_004699 [Penicillium lagena]|uniref:uncharacterized protein n=1 Tax=Penicillium lagena TaxID=94218 RepID=UPI0025413CC0|nr:uncharacterized protein N7510_004699 [Penicillium lagena]KAJ5620715.1 hypothetical protein N7510_004699 [Penicillium lagena]
MPNPANRETEQCPPPPPPPENPGSRVSPYVLKLRTAPPNYYYRAPKTPDFVDPFEAPTGPYFFYGTLTDPSMIREILELEDEPELRPARISGYTCKLWGQYPALLDASDSTVEGAVYHVQTVKDGERLATYETSNYRLILVAFAIPIVRSRPKTWDIHSNLEAIRKS